ncbi:MAG: ROK family protein, partial [Candidatus Thermoplasmatota archaeon]|nr:ROK family protein [Candidatus Thermoplasmatota archaeon]
MRVLGIDVGGSGFRLGVFDVNTGTLHGELHRHAHGSTTGPEEVLSALETAIESLDWHGPIG